MTEETIDDVKQAYALLFKAHGAVVSERDALAGRVRELEGALETAAHAFGEIKHATLNPNWFTKGESAAVQHSLMWQRKGTETCRAVLASAPTATEPSDAERYRFIREHHVARLCGEGATPEYLDAAIDAAIHATKGGKL